MGSVAKNNEIAYKIPGPQDHLTLEVRHSANAWWMDGPKLHRLIESFEKMIPLEDACNLARITMKQYRYFAQLHPIIEDRRKYPYLLVSMKAKMVWIKAINDGDLKACWKWLEMSDPETFSLHKHRSAYGDLRRRYGLRTGYSVSQETEEYERIQNDLIKLRGDIGLARSPENNQEVD